LARRVLGAPLFVGNPIRHLLSRSMRPQHRLVARRVGLDLGVIERQCPGFLLTQMQDLFEQTAQRLQVPLAEIRDGAKIWRIEPPQCS
jgi:hypothetical protein